MDFTGIVIYFACVNMIALVAFGLDKSRARRGAWRISESALMFLAAVGGSVGALAGMRVFHHKTRKPLFSIGVPVLLVLQVAVVAWVAVLSV